MRKIVGFLALVALSASLTGCGRNTMAQVAMPTQSGQTSWASQTARSNYPMPMVQTAGTAQALPGGRAVATTSGYLYETNPTAGAAGYSYYNNQNPCLYPRAGQPAAGCGTGTAGYYAGQTQPAYPTTTTNPYGATTNPYGTAAPAYGTAAPTYGAATNPYGTTPAYGATTPAYGATTNPYGTAPAATNPYGTGVGTPTTYTGQSAPQTTSADRARSRIDTSSASTGSTSTTGKKGPSF